MFVTRHAKPLAEIAQEKFGLSRAEAEVAAALAKGLGVVEISQARSVSPQTVRTQLKSIFAKTGIHTQARLVAALLGKD